MTSGAGKDKNEPELGSAADGNEHPETPLAQTAQSISTYRSLKRLLRKRVKKFVALAPEVHAEAKPKTVHDVRVGSRRLQQAVSAFFSKPRSGKVRRLRRTPRQIRRALGEWRNCDVLIEIVARQQRRTRSESKRRAWTFFREYLLQRRSKEVARAEKKLLRQDLRDYVALANKLLDQSPDESPEVLLQRLAESVRRAWTEWQSALARAQETRTINDMHALRIASKDLRYRTELLFDVGHKQMKAPLKWLADLQGALGIWHDRQVLDQALAEAVGRRDVLLNELPTARLLLAELEADRNRAAHDVEKIFQLAAEHPGRKEMQNWTQNALTRQG